MLTRKNKLFGYVFDFITLTKLQAKKNLGCGDQGSFIGKVRTPISCSYSSHLFALTQVKVHASALTRNSNGY